jgi:sugar lactone lactonase YvrE
MESALTFAGYDVAHAWGAHGHNGQPGQVIFPDVMRWLWRDYPAPVKAGVSANSTLQEITIPEEGWRAVSVDKANFGKPLVTHDGVTYVTEPGEHSRIWQIRNGKRKLMDQTDFFATGIAFSPDGSLFYAADKNSKWIYSYVVQPDGSFADKQPFYWLHSSDIEGNSGAEDLAVDTHGNLYAATRMGIQVCDQNGRVRAILPLPAPGGPVLHLYFGGGNFDILYATDGKRVFSRRMKVPGYPQGSTPIAVKSQGAG